MHVHTFKHLGLAAVALLVACGGSTSGSDGTTTDAGGDTGATPSDTGTPGDDATTDSPGGDGAAGGTTVRGSADGTPFDTAAMALWLGKPDDPATTVVYVFSKPVKCADLATPGWDTRITDKTQFLEMKTFGLTPRTYTVTKSLTPAPGEASVNYTLSATTGTPKETSSGGGTVTLKTVVATTNVTGSFDLTFGSNKVSGTYDAAFCPGGSEP